MTNEKRLKQIQADIFQARTVIIASQVALAKDPDCNRARIEARIAQAQLKLGQLAAEWQELQKCAVS